MEQKYIQKFIDVFNQLDKIEDEVTSIKESIEKKMSNLQNRIEKYELKDTLSDKQDDILSDLQDQNDVIEEDVENISDFLDHINEALDLISFDPELSNKRVLKIRMQTEKLRIETDFLQRQNIERNKLI